jgi:hypothetical protein
MREDFQTLKGKDRRQGWEGTEWSWRVVVEVEQRSIGAHCEWVKGMSDVLSRVFWLTFECDGWTTREMEERLHAPRSLSSPAIEAVKTGGGEHAVLVVVCGRWPHFHIGESHSFFLCWNNYVPLDCDLKDVEPMFWSFLNACITCESRFKRIAGFGLDKVAFWDISFFFFFFVNEWENWIWSCDHNYALNY